MSRRGRQWALVLLRLLGLGDMTGDFEARSQLGTLTSQAETDRKDNMNII